jgi:hypothetical protein
MIRIQLSEAEAQRLERAFRSATDAKLRDRLNVARLLSASSRTSVVECTPTICSLQWTG